MEIIRGLHNLRACHQGCALTIGNFDGVHLGHIALLKQLKDIANDLKIPAIVMIFEPQPLEYFSAERAPKRLTMLRDKWRYLSLTGIDYLLCVKFDERFAAISASNFIQNILVEQLKIKFLLIGDDFRFGAQRKGDFVVLQQEQKKHDFIIDAVKSIYFADKRISSTAIRQALLNNDFILAESYLGRPYSLAGRVVHGKELGRTLGYPTANIKLAHPVAVNGVFAVEVGGLGEKKVAGVANIGYRPTVSGKTPLLEVNLIDINKNLYGYHLDVILRKKLRDEQRFSTLDELKKQIAKDSMMARSFFQKSADLSFDC